MFTTTPDFTYLGIDMLLLLTLAIAACIVLIYVTIVFLVAQAKNDNSVMDIFYGPAFATLTWGTIYLTDTINNTTLLMASLVSLWALRLCIRILRKNWGKPEDARYAAWRTAWMQRGRLYFIVRSYLQINLLQGIIVTLVSLPMIIVIASGEDILSQGHPLIYLGVFIWLLGLSIESIADYQLDQFIARKKAGTEPNILMTSGLFYYSRRPNYFGESLIWWGLAIMAVAFPYGYLALLSPLLITFILTKVTGPLLEDLFLEKYPEAYRRYMATTNYFIPWPPKKSPTDIT